MLEVNDFNAIRLMIASPDQIRRWSYGEVVKPETINYRTLKPEKDGLFCERIFGPQKDWECACGKYKRVRFRGIVCDKCGVEVARAKVRRERMGHIELASPVTHIWYFKGIPSQLGLLLDLSPRNLEKVLYFASYVVTSVDEEQRRQRLVELDEEVAERATALERATTEEQQVIESRVEQELIRLETEIQEKLAALQERRGNAQEVAEAALQALESALDDLSGKTADEDVVFDPSSAVIVSAGDEVTADHVGEAREAARQFVEDVERQAELEERQLRDQLEEEAEHLRGVANVEIDELARKMNEEIEAIEGSVLARRQETEKLQPMTLLTDAQHRETQEACGPIFEAGMGAEALLEIIRRLDLDALATQLREDVHSSSTQRRKRAIKRLRVVEAFRKSGAEPTWMILSVLPVLPPDLRPMVQLDGGRFATSDLNDLYRRVINRNNRLKRLLDLGAPEIIIRNEKRMLQEAVDALIDNGRRGRAVAGSTNHKLKSLSDMLKGKQGRFRQNLLGKRVDYSGRSVIVVGPTLKINQCGLPKRMALELFKPFVMRELVERGHAPNIKSAKRIVERARPVVWDVLEDVTQGHPVLLNRAPTLHRLGIQAFEVVLVEGSAIQIHPLVCTAYNADFDGDTMSVHVPLSSEAQREAYELMLSTHNLLSPADGSPLVAPTKDMVLGCYYLTLEDTEVTTNGRVFADFDEVALVHELGEIDLQTVIKVQVSPGDFEGDEAVVLSDGQGGSTAFERVPMGGVFTTTVGRVLFNRALPVALRYENRVMDKGKLKELVARTFLLVGRERTAEIVDQVKDVGFHYATVSGITVAIDDIKIPEAKHGILEETDTLIEEIESEYNEGLMTEREQYEKTVEAWTAATTRVTDAVQKELDRFGSVYMMAESGASKGHFNQIRQLAGMRGLMAAPTGKIIPVPVRSNLREGLSVLEYFISTHGARKGLADTALRTADSGYLTRRLVDVAQDVIVREEDCGTTQGVVIEASPDQAVQEDLGVRVLGRFVAEPIAHPETGEVLVEANAHIDEFAVTRIMDAGVTHATVRSPLTCQARYGLCIKCYGRNLADGQEVTLGTAVGIIAAQSIGEPGTQLTMRTFHTGGIAGEDITSGLPRVEELFEARVPKGMALISAIDGKAEILSGEPTKIRVTNTQVLTDTLDVPEDYEVVVEEGTWVEPGDVVAQRVVAAKPADEAEGADGSDQLAVSDEKDALVPVETEQLTARTQGNVVRDGERVIIRWDEETDAEYSVPATSRIRIGDGDMVKAGDQLTEGPVSPQDLLAVKGERAVQEYLAEEVQKVYSGQAVSINNKHIEVIVRQMLRKVRIDEPGDADLLPGELVDRFKFEEVNEKTVAENGEPGTAQPMLLGITKASLATESFLAAASFQETTRVLTEAAVEGRTDKLLGLKENVIIGKLIPAGTGMQTLLERQRQRDLLEAGLSENGEDGDGGPEASEGEAEAVPVLFGQPGAEVSASPEASESPETSAEETPESAE
ncbi:MAG: DNA-directed RNA polymerase subunit beta' [Dehalococcoidia bacterium]|nr:DNA-directed RNA polymerase subunit beta' [Dehalococcoidia bacterium]